MNRFIANLAKVLSLVLLICVLFAFAACNSDKNEEASSAPATELSSETVASEYVDDGQLRIFSDGEYRCKIIRPENATEREIEVYTKIRNIFKEVTGVTPPISTDFKAHDEVYSAEEFAILIGSTEHDEAAELYSRISYSETRAELINKKYVIGFHDIDTALSALETFKALLQSNFKNGELILTEKWNYSHSNNEILESIPRYNGGTFIDVYRGAYDMQTVVIKNTDANEYNSYLTDVAAAGFTPYTDNTIGKNLFATFSTEKYYLNTMFFDKLGEVRITMEYAGNYSLPALKEENIYTPTGTECTITQIGLEESAKIQNGMSYIIKLADGSFIVVDGGTGTKEAIAQFIDVIKSLADDPDNITIASWIITHAHGDHMGLLMMMLYNEDYYSLFNIEQIIWSKVSEEQLANMDMQNMDYIDKTLAVLKDTKIVIAHPGQKFYLRNAVYTVFATIEMVEPIKLENLNDTSVVGRLEIDGKSILFPGDSHPTETEVVTSVYMHNLRSDVVQVIHHGYQGGNATFYSLVDPLTVLWPLGMKNYSTAEPPNTPMKTWAYSAWLFSDESKVQNIYVAGSDVTTLPIKDLPSHTDG